MAPISGTYFGRVGGRRQEQVPGSHFRQGHTSKVPRILSYSLFGGREREAEPERERERYIICIYRYISINLYLRNYGLFGGFLSG